MAVEKVNYCENLQGTYSEMQAMDKTKIVAGTQFWCWDAKAGYKFAAGDWRPVA
jgi:hypothetical protein